jgi:predicted small integral membrane protein
MFAWMHWTVPSAIGVAGVFSLIVGLNVLGKYRPSFPRKGFFPMETNRGDRVFLSIVSSLIVWIFWMRFLPEASLLLSFLIIVPLVVVIMKWG